MLDISKFLVPKSVPEDYCWEETDTSFVFRLSSLSELPTGARGAGCSCFSSLDTVISDEDTDVEDSGEESGHDDSGYLDDHQGTSLIKLPISWKAVYDSESGQEYYYHTSTLAVQRETPPVAVGQDFCLVPVGCPQGPEDPGPPPLHPRRWRPGGGGGRLPGGGGGGAGGGPPEPAPRRRRRADDDRFPQDSLRQHLKRQNCWKIKLQNEQ